MHARGRPTFVLLALLLGTATAPPAAAERRAAPASAGKAPARNGKPDARKQKVARDHFEIAERAFNIGRFDEALARYQAAYDALPLPAFLFNIAQCHRNLRDDGQALFFYQRYLSLDPQAPNRRVVEELIAEQQTKVDAAAAASSAEAAADDGAITPPGSDLTPRAPAEQARPQAQAIAPADTQGGPLGGKYRWWIWGVLGAVVAGGLATAVLSGGGSGPSGQLGVINAR